MFTRSQILQGIRSICQKEYAKIDNWIHDINHVKGVVKFGREIAKKEGINPFLVEIACWLHDLGRVGEPLGLDFKKSNHAEVSYQMGKEILAPFIEEIGKKDVEEILLAVREHSLPKFKKAGKSKIAQILRDADRGMGLQLRGIYTDFNFVGIIDMGKPRGLEDIKKKLEKTKEILKKDRAKRRLVIKRLKILAGWYEGDSDSDSEWIVEPLCTETARRMFRKGYGEIKSYLREIRNSNIEIRNNI